MKYINTQPKDGDSVLLCGHASAACHWFILPDNIEARRPDGSIFAPKWLVACAVCFEKHKGHPEKIQVVDDAIWSGDSPVIEAEG